MGVREFLSYVVPSNTLDSEQFRARCIDVMQVGAAAASCPLATVTRAQGSVRRTQEAGLGQGAGPATQTQLSLRFRCKCAGW